MPATWSAAISPSTSSAAGSASKVNATTPTVVTERAARHRAISASSTLRKIAALGRSLNSGKRAARQAGDRCWVTRRPAVKPSPLCSRRRAVSEITRRTLRNCERAGKHGGGDKVRGGWRAWICGMQGVQAGLRLTCGRGSRREEVGVPGCEPTQGR